MKKLRIYQNGITNELLGHVEHNGRTQQRWPMVERNGHLFFQWLNDSVPSAAFITTVDHVCDADHAMAMTFHTEGNYSIFIAILATRLGYSSHCSKSWP